MKIAEDVIKKETHNQTEIRREFVESSTKHSSAFLTWIRAQLFPLLVMKSPTILVGTFKFVEKHQSK